MEDDLLECHKQVHDNNERWLQMDSLLLQHTAAVDYDQEGERPALSSFSSGPAWLKPKSTQTHSLSKHKPDTNGIHPLVMTLLLVVLLFPTLMVVFLIVEHPPQWLCIVDSFR